MIITKRSDYALRVCRALRDGKTHNVREICEKEDIPKLRDFLETQERRGNFFSKAMEKTREQNSEAESEGVAFS